MKAIDASIKPNVQKEDGYYIQINFLTLNPNSYTKKELGPITTLEELLEKMSALHSYEVQYKYGVTDVNKEKNTSKVLQTYIETMGNNIVYKNTGGLAPIRQLKTVYIMNNIEFTVNIIYNLE